MKEKKFSEVFDLRKRLGKILFAGKEGSGKTLAMAILGVEKMLRGQEDCWQSYDEVDEYNELGYNFSKNYEHLVYSNVDMNCDYTEIPSFKSYEVDPFRLGLYSGDYETDLLPPGACVFVDEAHVPFNAYMWQYVRPEVTGYWTTSRQYDISLIMATNRPKQVVNFIRELCNRIFYFEDNVEEVKKNGEVVGYRFPTLEFNDNACFEAFLRTGKKENCDEYIMTYNQCRYPNYDTRKCRFLHVRGREFADFVAKHYEEIKTIEDVERLYKRFGFDIPEGYYLKPSEKAKKQKEDKMPGGDLPPDMEEIEYI